MFLGENKCKLLKPGTKSMQLYTFKRQDYKVREELGLFKNKLDFRLILFAFFPLDMDRYSLTFRAAALVAMCALGSPHTFLLFLHLQNRAGKKNEGGY